MVELMHLCDSSKKIIFYRLQEMACLGSIFESEGVWKSP